MKPDPIKTEHHSPTHLPGPAHYAHEHEHELLLSVERAGRRNRRSSRDRLRWDRELWDAYLRSSAANDDGTDRGPDHSDAA